MLPNPFEIAKFAVVAALAGFVGYWSGYPIGRADGLKIAEARAAKATIEQLKERGLINEAVDDLDVVAICLELGGLPEDCNQ